MFVAAITIGIGLVCIYYGARSLQVGRALRQLRGRSRESPSDFTDWTEASEETRTASDRRVPEQGSIERGFILLVIGVLCFLFGVIAV